MKVLADNNLSILMNEVRHGNKDAFGKLYQDIKVPVYTIIWRIVRNTSVAEEIMQELFLKIYVSPPDENVKNIRAWIFSIAHNLAVDYLRKHKSDFTGEVLESNMETADIIAERRVDINSAVNRLTVPESEIITLHTLCGFSFKEISVITKKSIPSVYRLYRKAIKNLHKSLNGGYEK